ncbi:hypothetical protein FA15DRAFT_670569 [Coprinopsis marcescibilis]|uniref:C3H1-type domain-containing protein n=1 Tax=Coprinopsis marcescibilis TaxID=230819 RepID=A0A5C3KSH0_COPMA|nr:hypothetical protein FA15DRAFT_670569 [Coprinopsis marcescibilis]
MPAIMRNLESLEDITSDDSDSGAPILQPITKEELRATRAERRAVKAAEIHAKAEVFKRMGDELFAKERYQEAYIPYLEASQIWPSNIKYYLLLAAVYSKLEWYEEAAHAATRALTLDPKSVEARYLRALARLEQRLLTAAKIDLELIVGHDPSHKDAQASLAIVQQSFDDMDRLSSLQQGSSDVPSQPPQPTAHDLNLSYPNFDDEPLEVDSVSNSSDCHHRGNGVPCRFYNRGRCGKGIACPYSHAPDEKSVRDELGHNVCIYFLLETCKFGETKCVYSHTKDYLPSRGWWSDPEKTQKIKGIIELTEKTAKEQRALTQLLRKQQSKAGLAKLKGRSSRAPETATAKENGEEQGNDADSEAKERKTKGKRPQSKRRKPKKTNGEEPAVPVGEGAAPSSVPSTEAKVALEANGDNGKDTTPALNLAQVPQDAKSQ